jgi:hypothetical protein
MMEGDPFGLLQIIGEGETLSLQEFIDVVLGVVFVPL